MKWLTKLLPSIIFFAFISLICVGLLVAWKYGAVVAYIGFAWLIPLAGIIWLKGEGALGFYISFFNLPFILTVILMSLLALLCFPMLASMYWGELSALWRVGLVVSALLHGFPLFMYLGVYASVLIWGK